MPLFLASFSDSFLCAPCALQLKNPRPSHYRYAGRKEYISPQLQFKGLGSEIRECFMRNKAMFRPRGIYIWGPTRFGKTLLARSFGVHGYCAFLWNLDCLSDEDEYYVFDDMTGGLANFPHYKMFLGGQRDFSVTDKYRAKKMLTGGKVSIWVSNDDPMKEQVVLDWVRGNIDIFFIAESMV